uniref:Tripartite motif-containing protein 2 n=1 Tax=Magallana gigas TaxID=29159 RepID=A0A8W8M4N8_MAGGI
MFTFIPERVDKLEETADCSPSKRKKTSKERVDKLEETADCSPSKRKKTSKDMQHIQTRQNANQIIALQRRNIGDLSSVPLYLKSPALELSIDVPDMLLIHHITSIKSDRLWLGGISYKKEDILKQVDSSGNVIETINDADISLGNFAMTQKGELLYLEKGCNKVQKKTPKGTTTIITTSKDENIRALFSSQITGDLLVGVHKFQTKAGKLTRYDKTGAKIQDIEVDNHGKTLYSYPVYIAENRNGDIVTVDSTTNKVVLVDKLGGYRDYYKGQSPKKREFNPHGVCTDVHGHIMVVDYSSGSIHLLDQDLHFLTLLMTKEQHNLKSASALFVDEKHHLYVGSENGRINVYKYLKDM